MKDIRVSRNSPLPNTRLLSLTSHIGRVCSPYFCHKNIFPYISGWHVVLGMSTLYQEKSENQVKENHINQL